MEDCFCLAFQLLFSSFAKSSEKQRRLWENSLWALLAAFQCMKPDEANSGYRYSEPALVPDLKQEQHTPVHLVCRRLYNWYRNLVLPKHPVFLQNSPESLCMIISNPEWHRQCCQTQDLLSHPTWRKHSASSVTNMQPLRSQPRHNSFICKAQRFSEFFTLNSFKIS